MTHASHGADAFRGLAVRHQLPKQKADRPPRPSFGPSPPGLGWMG